MSYSMHISDQKFALKPGSEQTVFDALAAKYPQDLASAEKYNKGFKHFPILLKLNALTSNMNVELKLDKAEEKVVKLDFNGVGRIDDEALKDMAPFVEAGSYLEMTGEDGAIWRYVFDGQKMEEKWPKIVWE